VPASAVAGTYSVPYQICATPANAAPLAAACDNAVATIVVQGADMVSRITCTPTSAAPGTTVTCTATCTNNGPAPAVNAVCTILNVAGLPAGASTPVCTGSPAASLAAGATLTCTVTFPMPALSSISVAAGAAADNDAMGGSDPAAVNNNASSVSFGALLAVPGLDGLALALLGLLLAGIGFWHGARRRSR
ncbi:MAG TPA: CARDB domain-containing protein, partial [Casimicrobium huifangae]|nr:CARDB domain-containing protein [Casimicrobium huifangae]